MAVGVQLLFWVVSGFYFTLFPISEIRGDHLKNELEKTIDVFDTELVPPSELAPNAGLIKSITLRNILDRPVYEVDRVNGTELYDARSGRRLSPIAEPLAEELAMAYWAGDGVLEGLTLLKEPPQEASTKDPVWQARFRGKDNANLYILADTGTLRSVRTTRWRIFDVLWGLHIMDWTNRETFTSWWMKLFSGIAILMAISGLILGTYKLISGRFLI